ncbi:hypothetical protein CGH47_22255, partial [Vibrio parahaemolyticus]|uniref:hypothetical protein n=1 Tax=Vibrio parahaemolyticus TaxID=670 RepID=UPI001175B8A9
KAAKSLKPTATKTPKKLANQRIKMEFEKANFQSKFSAIKAFRRQIKLKQFEPKEVTTNWRQNLMRQPANFDMFYGLSDS